MNDPESDIIWSALDETLHQPTSGDLRFGASYPTQLAPSPDYALASEDLGNLPERCSCDEAVTLLALLASAQAHVPVEDTDWHARAAAMLSGA